VIKTIKKLKLDARGFTLIEVIASLILLGIMAVMAGMGIVQITKQYVFAQKAGESAQVAQVAMARMVKELALCSVASAAGDKAITFKKPPLATVVDTTIGWTGSDAPPFVKPILMNGQPLIENVQNLTLRYYNTYDDATVARPYDETTTVMIGISFEVIGADGISSTFTGRAFVRN
jgi:prepilin-type N-terminal cleavage/methylation domain-containing protein